MKKSLLALCFIAFLNSHATNYYVSTTGNDANPGTLVSPFANWEHLENILQPGDTAFIRGGSYSSPRPYADEYKVWIVNLHGTLTNPIVIQNYPGEIPILDFTGQLFNTPGVYGLYFNYCDYVHVKGLKVTGLAQNPNGNSVNAFCLDNCFNCTIELCEVYNNGGSAFVLLHSNDNLILNCDAHNSGDEFSPGYAWGGTNGFAITGDVNTSTNNTFKGCRAWEISDNGFAFFASRGIVTLENCWAFRTGWRNGGNVLGGDGVGFKLGRGYSGTGNTTTVLRTLKNCLAFENSYVGFDENVNQNYQFPNQLDNCTAYKNGLGTGVTDGAGYSYLNGYNFSFYSTMVNILRNNIAYVSQTNVDINPQSAETTNSWNGGVTVSDADFLSISSVGMNGPRQADGSLPNLNFLKLAPGSDLIDAGTNITMLYNGSAPDMGAFESGGATNLSPTANAGSNQTITLPTSAVTLNGSGTDTDGTITSYTWTQQSGPNTAVLSGANTATLTTNGLVAGTYVFRLTVTDNLGATGFNDVTVIVNPSPSFNSLRLDGGLVSGTSTYESKTFVPLLPYLSSGTADNSTYVTPIANTFNDGLYQSECWNATTATTYTFPINNGNYTVHFHFADWHPSGPINPGDRLFDVSLQGITVLSNLDIIAEVGKDAALVKSFTTTVTNNIMQVSFTNNVFYSSISAIEILPQGTPALNIHRLVNFVTDGTPGATINGITTQTVSYATNATTVTANVPVGYNFVNWTGTGGFVATTSNPLTIANVTTNMTVTANYSAITTSLKDNSINNNEYVLYPNPVNNELTIVLSNTQNSTLIIKDVLGKIIKSYSIKNNTDNFKIDVSQLAKGIYFLTIMDTNGINKTQRFLKQ